MSAATFVRSFVKPDDHVAVVTYSMKPKVIQDFTGDSARLYQAVVAASRDTDRTSARRIFMTRSPLFCWEVRPFSCSRKRRARASTTGSRRSKGTLRSSLLR